MTFKSVKSNNYVSVLTLSFDIWVDNMDTMVTLIIITLFYITIFTMFILWDKH